MQKTLSSLPVPTWSWLKINGASLPGLEEREHNTVYAGSPVGDLPRGVTVTDRIETDIQPADMLRGTAELVEAQQNQTLAIHVPAGVCAEDPIVLDYRVNAGNSALNNRLHIAVEAGAKASVFVLYQGEAGTALTHSGYITLDVAVGANLSLTVAQLLPNGALHAEAVQANIADNGSLQLLLADLGAEESVSSADIRLAGQSSHGEVHCLYGGSGSQKRDMNYRLTFIGEETAGSITARGVLNGEARKTLRSTIDFLPGAGGAVGREEESVLVLSDKVVNISTPLLLCGEDNVEGQHATNIGRPDKNKLYYLQSRGLSEKAARRLLAEASLAPLLDKVELPVLREELAERVRKAAYDEKNT